MKRLALLLPLLALAAAPARAEDPATDAAGEIEGPISDLPPKPVEVREVVIAGRYRPGPRSRLPGERTKALARWGASASRTSVLRALRWLKTQQLDDGSWPGNPVASTALALWTYLDHGALPGGDAEFGPTVERAVRFLVEDVDPGTGRFRSARGDPLAQPLGFFALALYVKETSNPVAREAANAAMAAKIAARFDITAADAKRRFGYGYLLSNEMEKFRSDVQKGTYPGCREPGFSVEAAAAGIMDRLVARYAEKLAIVDDLQGVSDETRAALKAIIAKQIRPDKAFLDARHAQKIAGKADGAALLAALDAPDATDESRFEAIRKYADDLDEAFRTEFPGAAELGFDDFLPVVSLVRAFLIGSVPGLGATLERLSADPFALRVGTHFQQPEHHGHPMRATVGSTLF